MNNKKDPFNIGMSSRQKDLDDLEKIAGVSFGKKQSVGFPDEIVKKLAPKSQPQDSSIPNEPPHDEFWHIHNRFVDLYKRHGKPFSRFLGDILDILMSGPFQTKLVNELITEKLKQRRKIAPAEPITTDSSFKVPPPRPADQEIKIGGEPRIFPRNYLKRKSLLAAFFLESEEYPSFLKLMKNIGEICKTEYPSNFSLPTEKEPRKTMLQEIVSRLKDEINREDLLKAWILLEKDCFEQLEWVFQNTKDWGLVRPAYYEDLDQAYREAKKLLKLLITDFAQTFPPDREKQGPILDYLQDILDVYTHHHFVLKYLNQTKVGIPRREAEQKEKEINHRVESLKNEINRLRDDSRKLSKERDEAVGISRNLQTEKETLTAKLQKLDPVEVEKQLRAMEAKMNQALREHQGMVEEEAELRTALREMDVENQKLTQKLRDLHAIPDEQAKSVEGLLIGKRVVVFGGVGRDHYWPLLKEAGVKEADYEWYEGYHTISQARTAEIVGRHDVIAVITSYAGHLILWQTREAVTPRQTHFLIHHSGAGSLRQKIIDKFRKP